MGIYGIHSTPYENNIAVLIAFLALNIWRWFCMINLSAHLEFEPLEAYDESTKDEDE
jgi:hypothetical protein|tara:strand:+ start:52 stop:222 length:171 start_codon:yes stop_codon:yes gene_type:complete